MEIDRARKPRSIICYYGIEKQLYKLVEEMAELTHAIMKGEEDRKVFEEIADVEVLLDQLRLIMSRKERTFIEETKTEKIERTLKQIEMEE